MNKTLPPAVLLLTAIVSMLFESCSSPSFTINDDRAIRQLLDTQQTAWNTGDIDSFMTGYEHSDSLQFVGRHKINFGWQTTLDNYKKNYPDTVVMGKLHFNILRINPVSADAAFLTGTYHLKRTIGDAEGIFTLVLRKINGAWLIVYDHTAG